MTFRIEAADGTVRLGEIDAYERCQIVARYNDVSSWELTLPTDSPAAGMLRDAYRPRIIVYTDTGGVFRSGPVTNPHREVAEDGDMTTFSGADDLVWLRRRVAHPQPATLAPPYNAQAEDVQTGAASTVIAGFVNRNAGPAAIAARQVPGLTVPTPTAAGDTITAYGRYQNLLDLIRPLAETAGLGFRVRNLAFEVFTPAGEAIFSQGLGTLAGFQANTEAPEANYLYVGGTGTTTSRVIREVSDTDSVDTWGRIESFTDASDKTTNADLDAAGAAALADTLKPPGVEMQALDTAGQRFVQDWDLGSLATVRVHGTTVYSEIIREVTITLEGNRPPVIVPTIGGAIDLAIWRELDSLDRRVRQLERK